MIWCNLQALLKCIAIAGAFISVSMGFLIPTYLELFTDMATWSSLTIYLEEYIMSSNEKENQVDRRLIIGVAMGGMPRFGNSTIG